MWEIESAHTGNWTNMYKDRKAGMSWGNVLTIVSQCGHICFGGVMRCCECQGVRTRCFVCQR